MNVYYVHHSSAAISAAPNPVRNSTRRHCSPIAAITQPSRNHRTAQGLTRETGDPSEQASGRAAQRSCQRAAISQPGGDGNSGQCTYKFIHLHPWLRNNKNPSTRDNDYAATILVRLHCRQRRDLLATCSLDINNRVDTYLTAT